MELFESNLSDKLFVARGSIFDMESKVFDGAVAFLEPGFRNLRGDYLRLKEELRESPIPFLVLGYDSDNEYLGMLRDFHNSMSAALAYVENAVSICLSKMKEVGCRRIAFHGIRIIDVPDFVVEGTVVKACLKWVEDNFSEIYAVILVDLNNCYLKHVR